MAVPLFQRGYGAVVSKFKAPVQKTASAGLQNVSKFVRQKLGAESGIPFLLKGGASSRKGPVFKPLNTATSLHPTKTPTSFRCHEMPNHHGRGKPSLERRQVAETTTKAPKIQRRKMTVHSRPPSRTFERVSQRVQRTAHTWSATRNPTMSPHVLHGSKSTSQMVLSRVPHRSYSSGGSSGSNSNHRSTGMIAAISGVILAVCAYFVGSRERKEEAVDTDEEQLATVAESEDGDEDVIDVSTEDVTAPHDTLEEQEGIQRIVSTLKPTSWPKVTVIMGGGAMDSGNS